MDVPNADSLYFTMLNHNKRSITLDTKNPKGKEVLTELMKKCDVLVENFGPGVLDRMGFPWETIQKINPKLIVASIKGFGPGPYEDCKVYENVAQCTGGAASTTGFRDGLPLVTGAQIGDSGTGLHLALGIVTALYQRERTGKGTQVMSNLMVNGIWSNGIYAQAALCGATFQKRPPRDRALNAVTCHYKCSDDRWIILSLLNEEKQFPVFAKVIDREDLLTDPRFENKPIRHKNAPALIAILDEVFATKPLAHWRKTLDGNGLIFGVVGIPADIPDDPQMRETEAVVQFADSDLRTINTPIFIEGAKKVQPRMAPNVGQDSDEVLQAAGFNAAEIAKMRAAGIVA